MRGFHRPSWSLDQLQLSPQPLYEGKSSKVYHAVDKVTGATLLVKWYEKSSLTDLNRRQVDRELSIHQQLSHENIVRLFGTFEDEQRVFLVEEFAEGGDLFYIVKTAPQGRLTEEQAKHIMVPLLCALTHLHSQGILHRDIKPENLVITANGVLKLADFGLAINLNEERPVTRLGTLDYMAPEVLNCPDKSCPAANKDREDLEYDGQVDVWASGVLAYELLAGSPPFEHSSRLETYASIVNHTAQDMVFPEYFSAGARDFIRAALHQDPMSRATAEGLLAHPWLQHVLPAPDANQQPTGVSNNPQVRDAARHGPGIGWSDMAAPGTAPADPSGLSNPFMSLGIDAGPALAMSQDQGPGVDEAEDSRSLSPSQPTCSDSDECATDDSGPGLHRLRSHASAGLFEPSRRAEARVVRADSMVSNRSVGDGSSGAARRGLRNQQGSFVTKSQQELLQVWVQGGGSSDGRSNSNRPPPPGGRNANSGRSPAPMVQDLHDCPGNDVGPGPGRSSSMPLGATARLPPGFSIPTNRPPERGGSQASSAASEHVSVAWPVPPASERPGRRSGCGTAWDRIREKSNSHECYVPVSRHISVSSSGSASLTTKLSAGARLGYGLQAASPGLDQWAITVEHGPGNLATKLSAGARPGYGLQAASPGVDLWAIGVEPAYAVSNSTRPAAPSPSPPPPISCAFDASVAGIAAPSPAAGRRVKKQASADLNAVHSQPRHAAAEAGQQRVMQQQQQQPSTTRADNSLMPLGLAALLSPTAREEGGVGEGFPSDRLLVSGTGAAATKQTPALRVRCTMSESGTAVKLARTETGERSPGILRRALLPVAADARVTAAAPAPAPPPRRQFFTKLWQSSKPAALQDGFRETSTSLPQLKAPNTTQPALARTDSGRRDSLRF